MAALHASDIAFPDENEAQQLVGRVFAISRTKVSFGKRDCGRSELGVERVEPRLYLHE